MLLGVSDIHGQALFVCRDRHHRAYVLPQERLFDIRPQYLEESEKTSERYCCHYCRCWLFCFGHPLHGRYMVHRSNRRAHR